MTKYQLLSEKVDEPYKESGIKANGRLQKSLMQILETGEARTGEYSGRGKHTSKVIWTDEVSAYLDKLGIAHVCLNDAARGGASGEVVKVTMPAFLKVVKHLMAEERKALAAAEEQKREEMDNFRAEVRKAFEMKEKFEEEYLEEMSCRLNEELHGNQRRRNRKSARKAAAACVAGKCGLVASAVDYVMSQAECAIKNFIEQ